MRIAIIDDELHCVKSLELHINSLFPKSEIVYKTTKPKEAIGVLANLKIDILFLDVEMPSINGFELLEQFKSLPFSIIFTTAYSQYAVQAFKAQAINYLLKPIDEDELKEAIDAWQTNYNKDKNSLNTFIAFLKTENSEEINRLLKHLKKEGLLESKITIPISDGYEFVDVKEILYCQSQNNYTYIFLQNGEKVLISKTLKSVEQTLKRFYFLRTHQSYLVNPNFMKKFMRSEGGYLIMSDNKQIPVSIAKRDLIIGIFEAISNESSGA